MRLLENVKEIPESIINTLTKEILPVDADKSKYECFIKIIEPDDHLLEQLSDKIPINALSDLKGMVVYVDVPNLTEMDDEYIISYTYKKKNLKLVIGKTQGECYYSLLPPHKREDGERILLYNKDSNGDSSIFSTWIYYNFSTRLLNTLHAWIKSDGNHDFSGITRDKSTPHIKVKHLPMLHKKFLTGRNYGKTSAQELKDCMMKFGYSEIDVDNLFSQKIERNRNIDGYIQNVRMQHNLQKYISAFKDFDNTERVEHISYEKLKELDLSDMIGNVPPATIRAVEDAIKYGIVTLPEKRKNDGIIKISELPIDSVVKHKSIVNKLYKRYGGINLGKMAIKGVDKIKEDIKAMNMPISVRDAQILNRLWKKYELDRMKSLLLEEVE